MADKDERQVYLKDVRISYPHLINKQKASDDAKPKFSASFLIDPSTKAGKRNVALIEAALDAACMAEFKKPFDKMKFKEDRCCYFEGDEAFDSNGDVKDGYAGMMVIKASNQSRVDLRFRNKDKVQVEKQSDGTYEAEDDPIYGGCYVEAILRVYGTKKGGSPGVFASLELVRFFKDGDRFGSPPVDDSVLDDLDDEDEDDGDGDDLLD